ncbi:hypothetical protein Ancab_020791 [Ancistrocladus abbreviatus]
MRMTFEATEKKKKKVLTTAITYLIYLVVFSILLILALSSMSKSKTPNLIRIQGPDQDRPQEKTVIVPDPQTAPPTPSIQTPSPPPPVITPPVITCDRSHYHYDICSINGPTVLDPTISTLFAVEPSANSKPIIEQIKPYPRKWENFTMPNIKEITLLSGPQSPECDVVHKAPALVFSAGGYTGNVWHDFSDGFVPLFITLKSFFSSTSSSDVDGEVVLVVEKSRDWWLRKYGDLLHTFSKYPILDLDNDNSTHCFPSAIVGLVSHGFMTIDPNQMPDPITLVNFRSFLDQVYAPRAHRYRQSISSSQPSTNPRPRLAFLSRSGGVGRVVLNQKQVKMLAEKVGFEVVEFEPKTRTRLEETYALLNRSQVMVGVHGAALTHLLFLRPGSVFIQVLPLGTEWVGEACYGKPAKDMDLDYMEYNIGVEESSLANMYDKDDLILKDPAELQKNGWPHEVMKIYLKKQNVTLDLNRFREYLKKAYKKAKRLMEKRS